MSKIHFIATKHAVYRELSFNPDSTIIDPWRYISPNATRRVRRIGENKPTLISLLVPSRGRPYALLETVRTAFETATHPRRIEVVAYIDDDDEKGYEYSLAVPFAVHVDLMKNINLLFKPRALLSECWNVCQAYAKGDIFMHCGDDIVFLTPGWDQMVRDTFSASEDKILLVQGDDLSPNREALATHGFLHRRWVETVGYFLPPLFSCDWNDVWLTEVADMIDRRVKLPFVTEHRHYSFGLREHDQTDVEREERGRDDDVVSLYKRTANKRKADAAKLKAVMA